MDGVMIIKPEDTIEISKRDLLDASGILELVPDTFTAPAWMNESDFFYSKVFLNGAAFLTPELATFLNQNGSRYRCHAILRSSKTEERANLEVIIVPAELEKIAFKIENDFYPLSMIPSIYASITFRNYTRGYTVMTSREHISACGSKSIFSGYYEDDPAVVSHIQDSTGIDLLELRLRRNRL